MLSDISGSFHVPADGSRDRPIDSLCNAHAGGRGTSLSPTPASRDGGPPGAGGGEAAVDGADVVARREDADGATFPGRVEPLLDQLAEHGHEPRVRPDRRGTDHVQAEVRGGLAGLLVEVV